MGFYTCDFCSDRLRPDYPRWYQYPFLLLLVRPYYCPHCGDRAIRPITSLRKLFGAPEVRDLPATGTRSSGSRSEIKSRRGQKLSQHPEGTIPSPPEQRVENGGKSELTSDVTRKKSRGKKRLKENSKRSKRSSSRKKSRRLAKQHYAEIASVTGQKRVSSYGGTGFLGRFLRKTKRRIKKIFGLSSKSRSKSAGTSEKRY